jgi:hypothetical protein
MDLKHLAIVEPNILAAIVLEEFAKMDTENLGFFTRDQFKHRWGNNPILVESVMGKKRTVTYPQFLNRFNYLITEFY